MYHKNENWIDIFADFINFFTTSLLWYLREGSKNRIVVYTAIFGDYDDLRPPKNIFRKINCVDYICFTDNEKLRSDVWDIKIIPGSDHRSLRLCAKEYRIFPHKYFSRYKYSIWIDGNRELFCDPRYLILKYLKSENFALFKHDLNGSIYEEGAHCKLWKKDLEDCINSQLEKYRKENFPAHFGCAVTSVILRKHNAEEVVNLMQKWWIEITEQSERDQISLMYVVWKNNMPIKIIPNAGRLNKWFPRRCHKLEPLYGRHNVKIENGKREIIVKPLDVVFYKNSPNPLYRWAGNDIAFGLTKYFNVALGNGYNGEKAGKINIFTKFPPSLSILSTAKDLGQKVIYSPVDYYDSEGKIKEDRDILSKCACVVLRSQSLVPYFSEYTRVYLVEHYSKHSLKEANPYKKDGFILWIGRFEHISYVIEFLRGNKLPLPIRFLSNMRTNRKSYDLGFNLLRQMGLKKEIKKYDIEEWDTEKQEQLMREAKAALDITGTTFKEIHKPSAKVQQFILSGIPVATNAGCNSYNYLKSKEFNICTPYETKRWLSEIYWEETVRFADKLKDVCSLQQVVDNYKEIISEQIVSR